MDPSTLMQEDTIVDAFDWWPCGHQDVPSSPSGGAEKEQPPSEDDDDLVDEVVAVAATTDDNLREACEFWLSSASLETTMEPAAVATATALPNWKTTVSVSEPNWDVDVPCGILRGGVCRPGQRAFLQRSYELMENYRMAENCHRRKTVAKRLVDSVREKHKVGFGCDISTLMRFGSSCQVTRS